MNLVGALQRRVEFACALATSTVPVVTSLGVGSHLWRMGIAHERIIELDWHEHHDFKGLRLSATPCQHFSGRGTSDRNRTLILGGRK